MAILLDGKAVSLNKREEVAKEVAIFKEEHGYAPALAVILVGEDPASCVYVRNKKIATEGCGMRSLEYRLPESTTEEDLLSLIRKLNADSTVNGILVQMPLPPHISKKKVIECIDPKKDVDAFHPINVGKIGTKDSVFLPCTPAGIMEILRYYHLDVKGKNCVIVGRSDIVGKPMALLMLAADATVTVCHSKTHDLSSFTKNADILVVAVGKAGIVTGEMIKPGAVVIDVGMNRNSDNKLCGDVDFSSAAEKASYITPVPGGVGPMTISMLLVNTLSAAKWQRKENQK